MTPEPSSELKLDAKDVFSYLRSKASRPVSFKTLARDLQVDEAAEPRLQALLDELLGSGTVVETGRRYGCPEKMNLVVGTLSAHPDGFGFVRPEAASDSPDLFVAGRNLGGAMHGDHVVARLEHRRRSGRLEGRIIRVLKRARARLVGKLEVSGDVAFVAPFDRRLSADVQIPVAALGEAKDGEIVEIEITAYPRGSRSAVGRVVDVLGAGDDARVDAEVIIREFDLLHTFPEPVLQEAAGVASEVTEEQVEGRADFRELPIVTIDGASAQDFDDAVYVETLPNGTYRLHVHIADVAFYVPGGSEIDAEARRRATSVYFPDRVLPMLPESLSNEICSLKPAVDRLVHSVLIDIDRDGRTVNYEFHDGVIHSAARMTYAEVAGVLGGDAELVERFEPQQRQFERMRELAQVLMEYRRERGSIDFDLPEPELVIDLRGVTEDIVRAERNVAHRIIEEFMIRANEVVASHMTWEGARSLFRVHEGPDDEGIERFREFVSGLGHTLGGGGRPQPRHFMELLERVEGRAEERVVAMLMLRAMKQARYQVDNEGHFGLASERYTHFTSPIRRYPDLEVHRLLKAERESDKVASVDVEELRAALENIAAECSVRERRAEEAERAYTSWKKVQFMSDKLGEIYEGHITGVQSFGFFVELEPLFVEGLVPVSSLHDDYYRFEESRHSLRGDATGRTFTLGDRVKVRVAKVDLERRRLDFALEEGPLERAELPPERRSRRRRRGRGRSRRRRADERGAPVAASASARLPEQSATAPSGSEALEIKPGEGGDVAAPAPASGETGGTATTTRRRRRGRRGGRRRSGAGSRATRAAEADGRKADGDRADGGKAAARKSASRKTATRKSDGRKTDERGDSKRAARSGGGRSAAAKGSGGARSGAASSRRSSRGGASRSSKSGSRGRSQRQPRNSRPPVEVKPAPTKPPERAKKKPDKEAEAPKVNPYLTEIDF